MPTYEYQCKKCEAVFDVYQSIKASPLRKMKCESCKAVRPVRRLIGTGGAILFKGSGFYQTDYRSEGYKKAAKAASEAAGGKSSGSDKEGGSKSEPSGGTKPAANESKANKGGESKESAGA